MPVRRRQPRRQEMGATERYMEMGIAAALSRPWDYPTACGELAALLRLGYADLPKAAQALLAFDVLFAFCLLPDSRREGITFYTRNDDKVQGVVRGITDHKLKQCLDGRSRNQPPGRRSGTNVLFCR